MGPTRDLKSKRVVREWQRQKTPRKSLKLSAKLNSQNSILPSEDKHIEVELFVDTMECQFCDIHAKDKDVANHFAILYKNGTEIFAYNTNFILRRRL